MSKYPFGAAAILIAASIIALASVWRDSPIVDEVPHIGAGFSYVAGHTYEFNPEHPPLAKDFAGLALLPLHINPSVLTNGSWSTQVNNQWNFGRMLIYHSGTDPIAIVHAAKVPMILFFIFSGLLIYIWTKKIYNPRTALLATFLFALSPTIVAHSRFVTTDVPALFGVLLSTYFFIRYLTRQGTLAFWLAAISFGIALLTKFSTFLLVPYFILLAFGWAWMHHHHYLHPAIRLITKSILIMAVGFIVVVGPIYQLHLANYPAAQQKRDTADLVSSSSNRVVADFVTWASDKPILRPYAQYGLGLAMVFQRASGGNRTYFLGELSNASFKLYFPVVFALKEPIPFLILLVCAAWFGLKAWQASRESFREKLKERFPEFAMVLWVLIYLTASINAHLNIGIRHLLPIYGFLYILVAGQIVRGVSLLHSKRWFKIFLLILCAWYAAEFVSVYPSYLSYFNEFAGGPSGGHRYVVDSNLDWGQDLWRLADFVKQKKIDKIYLDYFGWADQESYLGNTFIWMHGGQYTSTGQFLQDNPYGGWLAVSATYYQESSANPNNPYAWLVRYTPVTVIGNSILVWHITR